MISISDPLPKDARPYLLAVTLTGGAVLASWTLGMAAPVGARFLFVLPTIFTAHLGGLRPGLFAAFLATMASAFAQAVLQPSLRTDPIGLALLLLVGVSVALVLHAKRQLRLASVETPQAGRNLLAHQLRVSALEAQASRFQHFAQGAPIGIAFISSDGLFQFANDEYLRILGRTREEFEAERFRLERSPLPNWLRPGLGPRHE